MSLVRDWRLAKKRYDAAHINAQKQIKSLNSKLTAAQYFLQALRDNKLSDKAHMRKIDAYLDEFTPDSIESIQDTLFRELERLSVIEQRPQMGIENALGALEQILEAAEALIKKRANLEEKLALRLDHAAILKGINQRNRAVHDYLQRNGITG